ncbi:MAG: hypothetical protein AAF684_12420, partial [Pseudomonadota bacterium]
MTAESDDLIRAVAQQASRLSEEIVDIAGAIDELAAQADARTVAFDVIQEAATAVRTRNEAING